MMRSLNPAASMQKIYDDCYLICSTAIYFEKQNNEDEALRSWREALDQIYYHNAYKLPANYQPKSETERALQDSLRTLEMQCKERVDLLETLRQSRQQAKPKMRNPLMIGRKTSASQVSQMGWSELGPHLNGIGNGTIPALNYGDISRAAIAPKSTTPTPMASSRTDSFGAMDTRRTASAANLPVPANRIQSRSPSPDKKSSSLFKSSLRSGSKEPTRFAASMRPKGPLVAAKAATMAWPSQSDGHAAVPRSLSRDASMEKPRMSEDVSRSYVLSDGPRRAASNEYMARPAAQPLPNSSQPRRNDFPNRGPPQNPPPPAGAPQVRTDVGGWLRNQKSQPTSPVQPSQPMFPAYRSEYPKPTPINPSKVAALLQHRRRSTDGDRKQGDSSGNSPTSPTSPRSKGLSVLRKAVGSGTPKPALPKQVPTSPPQPVSRPAQPSYSEPHVNSNAALRPPITDGELKRAKKPARSPAREPVLAQSAEESESTVINDSWDARIKALMKKLPRGVDEQAAKSIFNEIVVQGDEVHWDDVAGLDIAKNALKEAVVYPFLRPDLFMGLREPARGMLLFGPPGTGKTMLARAVATESKSTFFAISASSLTSKYLGESEKLVRALFALAKALTPSIIFVDEIDSLLSARAGSGEHEATRRIKTEFLIQWSDLARAAAGKEQTEGDPSRVLVLAATNMPWAIDEAARRRFVRRQYIPLPEAHVRGTQLRKLMSAQKHNLKDKDFAKLVQLTDGFSGSDITALAKDAAMGPLRALGEKLLNMAPDQIKPISLPDFEASLVNIRPSVGKQGLDEYENWAKEFGERGG